MNDSSITIGLDVHVQSITAAAITGDGEIRELGTFPNTPQEIAKRVRGWGEPATMRMCYEAGPCGYGLARQLTALGVACQVIAPALTPRRPGDRVKTDRRDAVHLATHLHSNQLTAVPIPTPEQEALRALSRDRELAARNLHRCRQQLVKYLHLQRIIQPTGTRWTKRWWRWVSEVRLEQPMAQIVLEDLRVSVEGAQRRLDHLTTALGQAAETVSMAPTIAALQTFRGIGPITAVGIVAETGDVRRFTTAPALMAYTGIVPSEYSSGGRQRRGAITRTGNAHLRYLLIEAAWHATRVKPPAVAPDTTDPLVLIAYRAHHRTYTKFWRMVAKGKPRQVAIVAAAREFLGFIWDSGQVIAVD